MDNIPKHVALIMDGNRRWAKENNLSSLEGHKKGYDKMKQMPGWFFDMGVQIVSVFAFSTENWNRSEKEVSYLMKLLKKAFTKDFEEFNKREYKVLISGRIEELPGDLPKICYNAMTKTKNNKKGIFNICLNYGGRAEIIDAIQKMIENNIKIGQINEETIKQYLYHGELPDPDIIVRTSGEQRLSGYLLWESAYSELMFMKKYWPDFEKEDAKKIISEYGTRKRRYGGN